jgi:hypothetical protein
MARPSHWATLSVTGQEARQCRGSPRGDVPRAAPQVSEPGVLDVVVLEDIHWADEATIDLLRFLGRRIRDAELLLIATYRDDGLAATDPLRLAWATFLLNDRHGVSASRRSLETRCGCWPTGRAWRPPPCTG